MPKIYIYIYIHKSILNLLLACRCFWQRADSSTHSGRPADVDPARREQYLSDSDFQSVFGMSFADFQKSPKWKQQNAKLLGVDREEMGKLGGDSKIARDNISSKSFFKLILRLFSFALLLWVPYWRKVRVLPFAIKIEANPTSNYCLKHGFF